MTPGAGRALTLDDRGRVGAAMRAWASPLSESAFANLYLFRECTATAWSRRSACRHHRRGYDGEETVIPLFDLAAADAGDVRALLGDGRSLFPVEEHRAAALAGRYAGTWNEADSDYVYDAARMRALAGLKTRRQQADASRPPPSPSSSRSPGRRRQRWPRACWSSGWPTWPSRGRHRLRRLPRGAGAARSAGAVRPPGAGPGRAGRLRAGQRAGPDMAVIHFAKGLRSLDGVFPTCSAGSSATTRSTP